VEDGQSAAGAIEGARPPIHFRRKAAVELALRAWTAAKLADAMRALADALLQTRQQPGLAESIAQRAMITLATAARKKS
jgi:DNA polymerase-3 subunit delta